MVAPGFLTVLAKGGEPTSRQPNRPDYVTSGRRRAVAPLAGHVVVVDADGLVAVEPD